MLKRIELQLVRSDVTEQSQGYGMETYKNFPCGFFARCFLRNDRNNKKKAFT